MSRDKVMKKRFLSTVLLVVMLLPAAGSAGTYSAQDLCFQFVEQKLQSEGGIFTNYLPSKENQDLAAGHSVLSESQGLMLSYYAQTNNKAMAQKVTAFVRNRLDTGSILSYRLEEDGKLYKVNAAVDDLRLIGAMLAAAQAFRQPDVFDQAVQYAMRLYDTNVRGQLLADFYDDAYKQAGGYATLCYSDLDTMNAVAAYDRRWLPVVENMQRMIEEGYLGDTIPLYHTRYNFEKRCYESENVPMVESLLTVYHLSKINLHRDSTIEYLKETLHSGKLYSVYDFDLSPLSDTESTAIYALCALIGANIMDAELYQTAINRMLSFQVTDKKSPVYGAFADAKTHAAYSFDNLMALLALNAGKVFSQAI